MKTSRLLVSGLLLAGLLQSPAALFGQNKDIISLQRDIGQLELKIADLKTAQTARMDAVDSELKQVLDSNAKLTAALSGLQKNLADTIGSFSEQQGKQLLAPMATVSSRVDTMSTEFTALQQSVDALGQQISRLDGRLSDLKSTMQALSTPAPAPPPTVTGTTAPQGASNGAPAGFSAVTTFENASRDYYAGKDDLALEEFRTFLMYAAQTENGPKAYYYMGQIYYRGAQYDEAVKAFDAVIERYPENPSTPDAQLMKAQALMKAERRPEAIVEFKSFIAKYPSDPNRTKADMYLKQLTTAPAKPAPARNSKKR